MHDRRGVAAIDDLALLLVAVFAFSLFFASLAGAYVRREDERRGERLQAIADSLLAAVLDASAWTSGHGHLVAQSLPDGDGDALANLAENHPFRVIVVDLLSGAKWSWGEGESDGDRRTASAAAILAGPTVDPARVTATAWVA